MHRILVVDDDDLVRSMIVAHIENLLKDVEIVQSFCGDHACETLVKDQNFDLIFSDFNMPNGSGGDIWEFLNDKEVNIPFILNSNQPLEDLPQFENFYQVNKKNAFLKKPCGIEEIKSAINLAIKPNKKQLEQDLKYKKIKIYYFWRFNKTYCDVFIKLAEAKYLKLLHANENFSREQIRKYADKEVKYLYISTEDYNKFVNREGPSSFLEFDGDNRTEDLEQSIISNQEFIHQMLLDVGLTQPVLDSAQETVDNVLELTKKDSNLEKLISKIKDSGDYLYDHSLMVSVFCTALSRQMTWNSPQAEKKLAFASLFHDLTMSEPRLAYKIDLNLAIDDELDQDLIDQYENHAEDMAKLIKKYGRALPIDVDKIILDHHVLDHNTTPEAARVTPMTAVFIIAHNYVCELYKVDFDPIEIKDILENMKKLYGKGPFSGAMEALMKCSLVRS